MDMAMIDSLTQIRCGLLAQMTGSQIASWVAIGMVMFIIFGNKRRGNASCERGGWGKFLAVVIAVFFAIVAVNFIAKIRALQHHRAQHIHQSNEASRPIAVLERKQTLAVQQFQLAQTAQANELAKNMSMHQLWEKLHTPRIKLDGDGKGASITIGNGADQVAIAAPSDGQATVTVPLPDQASESLAVSMARLERVVAQATAVADRVTEAGTLMGRAMIALNETLDSRSRTASAVKATVTATEAAVESPQKLSADVAPAPDRIVEIKFDAGKLNAEGITFDKARSILGRDGYWRGNAVRFNPREQRIAVTGDLEPEYESRLANTLLGTSPKTGHVTHVSDVAVVTPNPDTIEIGVVESVGEHAGRKAWVDTPPKRIGNTWREVVVSGEYATKEECDRAADIRLLYSTYNHLAQLTGQTARPSNGWHPDLKFDGAVVMADGEVLIAEEQAYDDRLRELSRYGIGIDFVRREIAKDEYLETVDRSFGPMMNLYTLVEFTPSVDTELMRRWNEYRRDERLFTVGAGAGSVLGFLGLALGLLKVDTWTKGYYSKRLFLGVPAAIIGVLALLGLAAG
jgi:hypothetical protein